LRSDLKALFLYEKEIKMNVYGPVPSRRLGRSLGVNNIPPKKCTYACVYCQVGKTTDFGIQRKEYYNPGQLFDEVKEKLTKLESANENIDYIALVPDGEPTLDIHLGELIHKLKGLNLPVGVISNATLLYDEQVRKELGAADWVSVKVDAVDRDIWKRINRPNKQLSLQRQLEGIFAFSREFKGELVTETMLIQDYNDARDHLNDVADFIARIKPSIAYIAIPTRPPAKKSIKKVSEETLTEAYEIFKKKIDKVEYLIGYEGDAFSSTGDAEQDILSITSVHPMREEALQKFISRTNQDWSLVEKLLESNRLKKTQYQGHNYYMRKLGA